jgi:hypothetical protein
MPVRDEVEVTSLRVKMINSLFGGATAIEAMYFNVDIENGRPSPYDYLQIPVWFVQFSPGVVGTYVHDEIVLNMRQSVEYREVLSLIEDDEMLRYYMLIYMYIDIYTYKYMNVYIGILRIYMFFESYIYKCI